MRDDAGTTRIGQLKKLEAVEYLRCNQKGEHTQQQMQTIKLFRLYRYRNDERHKNQQWINQPFRQTQYRMLIATKHELPSG